MIMPFPLTVATCATRAVEGAHMGKTRKRKFDIGAVVREIARERIGQPKPTAVIGDKRERTRLRQERRDRQAELRGELGGETDAR